MTRPAAPSPRCTWVRLTAAASLVVLLAPSAATAQETPELPVPSTAIPTTTTPVDPPEGTPTSIPGPTSVPPPTSVDPLDPLDPLDPPEQPEGDGAEIPDPEVAPPGSDTESEGPDGAVGPEPMRPGELRAGVVRRLAESAEPLEEARRIEAEALAELAAADRVLAEARRAHDAADLERVEADAEAAAASATADRARRRAEEAADQLRRVAVARYLDPPAELAAMGALMGDLDDRLATDSLLAAQSEVSRRAARDARRADDAAARAEAAATAAARAAEDVQLEAEGRLAQLELDVARRAELLLSTSVIVEVLTAQFGGAFGAGIADLVAIEQVASSGSVDIRIGPDGAWSVSPVGFPDPRELVRITGTTIKVHQLIAAQVEAMVVAAAAEGVRLDGWGYRDSMRQVELRRAHCGQSLSVVLDAPASSCRPPTARPGRSMHERGLAIDFASCGTRSTPCYQWLSRNAARFGLLNLPSEPWHWSTNGN